VRASVSADGLTRQAPDITTFRNSRDQLEGIRISCLSEAVPAPVSAEVI
jgi:hypothetical protein